MAKTSSKTVRKGAKKKAGSVKGGKQINQTQKYKRKGSTMSGYTYGRRTSPGGRYTSTYRAGRCGKKPSRGE